MKPLLKVFFRVYLITAFLISSTTVAVTPVGTAQQSTTEQINRADEEILSIRVTALGEVAKSGLSYVPIDIDIIAYLGMVGGISSRAELGDVTIKRRLNGEISIVQVDVEDILGSTLEPPKLVEGDIVYVPSKEPLVSADVTQVMTFTSSLIAFILTVIVLADRL